MRLIEAARKGFKSIASGTGYTGLGWGFHTMAGGGGAGYDWNREAGLRYDNSVVYAAINYTCRTMIECGLPYVRKAGDPNSEIEGHPATELLANPNPWYDWATWLSGQVVSELASRSGMSYAFMHRSGGGKLIGFEYLPHFGVTPYSVPGSGEFIDKYFLAVRNGRMEVDPKNILALRYGPMNPLRPQISYGPIEACLVEVCTDKEALAFTASLLKNAGVTPHLVSPSGKDASGMDIVFGEAQARQIESVISEKTTGANRGRVVVSPIGLNIDDLSLSPADMNAEKIHNIAEERICAALGISPQVLNLGTGLENGNNRASADSALRQAARDYVKPYLVRKAQQLTRVLIPELGNPGEEVAFHWENMEALQDDKTEAAKRDELACGGPWETVNEVRKRKGMSPVEGGDAIRERSMRPQDQEEKNARQTQYTDR